MTQIPNLDPLTFEPSGQTDLWLAHKVMGWPVISERDSFELFLRNGGVIVMDRPQVFRFGTIPDAWHPSTLIQDAIYILRRMVKLGWVYSIHGYPAEVGNMVVFSKGKDEFSATASSESLAVCRAAGLAMIGDGNEYS